MKQNGFAFIPIIVILMILLLIGGGIFLFSNNSSNATDNQQADIVLDNQATAANSEVMEDESSSTDQAKDTSIQNLVINGWLTYSNSDMGFSIDYPNDWDVSEDTQDPYYKYIIFSPSTFLNGIIEVQVASSLTEQSICSSDPCAVVESKTVKIGSNNKTVDVYKVENSYGYPYYAFLTNVDRNNDDSLSVLVKYAIPQHWDGVEAILETFHFTD